jgi:hypothetical protein
MVPFLLCAVNKGDGLRQELYTVLRYTDYPCDSTDLDMFAECITFSAIVGTWCGIERTSTP